MNYIPKGTAERIMDKVVGFGEWAEEKKNQDHDCTASPEDGCKGCEELGNVSEGDELGDN